ncbi:MAG: gamma-glutamylcyclotransferase family protein [bacterium]|nr:gamma-glutamylcyclotransferase family protein [bacterium]
MENKLFIYGTLINSEVQKNVLGRVIKTVPDELIGYRKSEIKIEDENYPLIIPDKKERVKGLVIEVTNYELKKIDEYESNSYKREEIILKSGISAWVYVKG